MSLFAIVLAALLGSVLAWRLVLESSRFGGILAALLPVALFLAFASYWPTIAAGGVVEQSVLWAPSLDIAVGLRLDGFSLLFSLLITGIGTLVTLYAAAYFAAASARDRARFIFLILLFMASMLGTVLSDNLIVMYVFWEATSLTSFMLIGFESSKPEARRVALQSLLVTMGGGLALFAGILLIGMELGSFSLAEATARADELLESPYLVAIIVLVLLGAFTKSAQFPFHFWLPQAMAAPTPASAYLHSATMVKLGVYLLARFSPIFAEVPDFGMTLVIFGSATMLIAALNALLSVGYKAILAQSTVASLGILVMLIGLGGEVAAVATAGFILTHALYKAALFFCAGTAIHATGIAELRRLGGLAKFLPLTGLAAILASFSMAGLPPFIGFISKEYLFEAQLESDWHALPLIVAVLVNAVMVAVAAVVSLRPFFLDRGKISRVEHGETPGLLAGPLVLALLGILTGVVPGWVGNELVGPAASAFHSGAIDISFALWHGLTPMLLLSMLVVTLGLLLLWQWDRLHEGLSRLEWLSRLDADRGYDWVVERVLAAATLSTRWLQNGDQRHYTLIVAMSLVGIIAWVMVHVGGAAFALGNMILPVPTTILALAVVGALVAARSVSLVTALIGVGVVGYGSALLFLLNGAPDLALTQFAVETLSLVVITAVLVRLPTYASATRSAREKRADALLAATFALLVFVGLTTMVAGPFDTRLSSFFDATSYGEAHGRNVVNVILVDFRALDTLGEIAVVGFATLGAWALLRRRKVGRGA
ncbi:MAG TPA: hydrogen gas-evolving membrane-bound hydrogenase subunit E [Kiloniellales bacterium]|nr:hydrogen gas-evolving membrane-bound hydrogenase subunit E [Kiloniellales bacterium]